MSIPGTKSIDGKLVREITHTASDGSTRVEVRQVAEDWETAKRLQQDFYDPTLGWIRYGYKLERDRDTASILADNTEAIPVRPQ